MESKTRGAAELDVRVNEHRVRFLPPDTVEIWWNGRCTRDDFTRILDFGYDHMGDRPFFVLVDLSKLTTIDADARKIAATDRCTRGVAAIAMIGATFHTRVLMTMVTRAIEIFDHKQRGKLRFFDSEREAFAWIAEERERLSLGRIQPQESHEL